MSGALVVRSSALPSVEKARALLAAASTHQEVRKIRAIAQAIATLERGKEIACDAGEIIVLADKRRAELEREEKATRKEGRPRKTVTARVTVSKAQLVAESKRAPLLALSDREERAYFSASRKALQPATPAGAAALGKLPTLEREHVLAKLGDVPDVRRAIKQISKERIVARINAEPKPLPVGPFRVIVADPPWPYEKRVEDSTHRGANPYPTMSLEDIRALGVEGLAHEDAILWLWTTNAFMREAFTVVDAWGFREKTILTWAKPKMGVGDWLRGQTEHAILAVHGKPTVTLMNQTTLLAAPVREHSRKPEEFFLLVEKLCPGSKLELFARESRVGWASWGGEEGKFDGP